MKKVLKKVKGEGGRKTMKYPNKHQGCFWTAKYRKFYQELYEKSDLVALLASASVYMVCPCRYAAVSFMELVLALLDPCILGTSNYRRD